MAPLIFDEPKKSEASGHEVLARSLPFSRRERRGQGVLQRHGEEDTRAYGEFQHLGMLSVWPCWDVLGSVPVADLRQRRRFWPGCLFCSIDVESTSVVTSVV